MKLIWIAAMLLLPASLCAQNSKSGDLSTMITTLKSHAIKRVEILRIPDNVRLDSCHHAGCSSEITKLFDHNEQRL